MESLPLPPAWHIHELRMQGASGLADAAIGLALDNPVGAPALPALAGGRRTVAIAIDDLTRPTQTAPLLRLLVERLTAAGIAPADVTIIMATGAHRRATRDDFELKVGADLLRHVRVLPHDPLGDLVATDVALGGVSVRINRAFAAADLRIGVGAVMPHPFAGFSGGGKIVVPGLADLDVLARTHKFALMGLSGGGSLDRNRFRSEMEQVVRRIGLHWTVNVAVNERRETAFVAAGDVVAAHRAAVAAAERIGATPRPPFLLDALILNAYPKDSEVLQIEAALVAVRRGMLEWLAPGAPVVLTGACPEGFGHHDLFAPGGRLHRVPAPKTFLGGRDLCVFAPRVTETDLRAIFPPQYPGYSSWEPLVTALRRKLPAAPTIGVVPCGPLQIPAATQEPNV
jgi:nickel-dependent lactate racemase